MFHQQAWDNLQIHRIRHRMPIYQRLWEPIQCQNMASMSGRQCSPLPGDASGTWVVTECGGRGDCLFHSVGVALKKTFREVRADAAECVTEHNVQALLDYYTHVYSVGEWSRRKVANHPQPVEALREVFRTCGGVYQGDDTTLQLLSYSPLQVGFLVFLADGTMYRQLFMNKHTKRIIVLFHAGHWQLVGRKIHKDPLRRIQVTFDPHHLPTHLTYHLYQQGADVDDMLRHDPGLVLEQHTASTNLSNGGE